METNNAEAKLLNLPRHALVTHKGNLGRVLGRHLDPNRKPGLGRISYVFERALVARDGGVTWGVFMPKTVRASQLEVRS